MLLTTGLGMLAAAASMPLPEALAAPTSPDAPPSAGGGGPYIFADEFDGPAGSPPDPGKWTIQTWQDDVYPPVEGIYRDDRQNVFQDGHSNLVLCATHDFLSNTYYTGKLRGNFRSMINQTWEAKIKLDCLFPGLWPSFWGVNEDPLPDGEVDIFEWYGNGQWAPGTTVHAASNGKTWEGKIDSRIGRRRLAHLANALGRRGIRVLAGWLRVLQGCQQTHSRRRQPPGRHAVAVQQSRLLDDADVHPCRRWGGCRRPRRGCLPGVHARRLHPHLVATAAP